MRCLSFAVLLTLMIGPATAAAADGRCGHSSCTGTGGCAQCVPACKGTWDEAKTKKPKYSIKCDYACVRGFDPWHAPPPECRCGPPCGDVIVKKKLYKADGEEKADRVPKYEVAMVPAKPCECATCRGHGDSCWWHPLRLLAACVPW